MPAPRIFYKPFSEIFDMVISHKRPVKYIRKIGYSRVEESPRMGEEGDGPIKRLPYAYWDKLFGECQAYTKSKRVGMESLEILLTDRPNEKN